MSITLQSSMSADTAAAPGFARRCARSSGLVALLAMVTSGIGLLSTGTSDAQQSPEVVETIGDAYQIGRLRINGGMVVQTILYNGRPIATGVMLPGRAESAGASTPGAAGALEIAGTVLSGQVSGKYFILHRTRGNRTTIHEIFFDGESIGQVAEDTAALMGEPRRGNESQDGTNPPAIAHGSAFSLESTGDVLFVRIVQPDGTTIRATSHNGGRLEQVIERTPVAVPGVASNAGPVGSSNADRVNSGNAGPISSGNDDIANENVPRHAAVSGLENLPPGPSPREAKQSAVRDDDPTAVSSVGEPLKTALPKIRIPLPRQPPLAIATKSDRGKPRARRGLPPMPAVRP